jgi:hypothetical protein
MFPPFRQRPGNIQLITTYTNTVVRAATTTTAMI